MRSIASLRLYPGRVVGIQVPWNDAFMKWFKEAVPMRMWDPASKTWWFPISFLSLVEDAGRLHGVLTEADLSKFARAVPTAAPTLDEERAWAFKALHLLPTAPTKMVDSAYWTLRRELELAGSTFVELNELSRAYRILGGVL